MGSRGAALSAYSPLFEPKSSAYVFGANLKAQFLSGTLVSGGVVTAVTHNLAKQPKFIMVGSLPTKAQALSGNRDVVLMQAASATTSTTFYIMGSQVTNTALKWNAWLILN